MRRRTWLASSILGIAGLLYAQSPADGSVRSGVYLNAFFKIEYSLPADTQAVELSTLRLGNTANGHEFALMAAREGSDPYGIVLIAEPIGVGRGFFPDEEDFLHRVRVSEHVDASLQTLFLPSNVGSKFHEIHYNSEGHPTAAVVLRLNGYLLVWRCNGRSQRDLSDMLAAIHNLRKTE